MKKLLGGVLLLLAIAAAGAKIMAVFGDWQKVQKVQKQIDEVKSAGERGKKSSDASS
jgi:hypothetical protein